MDELPKEVTAFFESGGETAPVLDAPAQEDKPAAEPEVKSEAPPADKPAEKPADKPAAGPKDPPEVERENLKKALDEERSRRKQIADELRSEAAKREELEKKFSTFMQKMDEQSKPKPPAFEEDPAAHLRAKHETTEAELKALQEKVVGFERQTEDQRKMSEFQTSVQAATATFMQDKPDYKDAYKHVRSIRKAELTALGVEPSEAESEVSKWELNLAYTAMQRGKNPAEVLYMQAQALGYKQASATNGAPSETNKQSPSKKIEQIAKGQDAAATLGTGRSDQPFSLEKLAEMDEDAIEEFVKSSDWNKLARMT